MNLIFNEIGNLPPGCYEITFDDAKSFFVDAFPDSETRLNNWNSFYAYIQEIISIGLDEFKLWVDGSFVTKKLNPNDIDCVIYIKESLLNSLSPEAQENLVKYLIPKNQIMHEFNKNLYCTDSYLLLDIEDSPNSPYYDSIMKTKQYWEGLWGHDRQGNAKGYIILSVKGGRCQ